MEPGVPIETRGGNRFCPQCGSLEKGYFCHNCGELLRGEEMVLCPRCHQVVPGGGFCVQCGQGLAGIALTLRQLATAGDTFWLTAEPAAPATRPKPAVWVPDDVKLAAADLPTWLQELSSESAPADVKARIYPALKPIKGKRPAGRQGRFLALSILLIGMLLLGLLGFTVVLLLRTGV